MSSFNYHTCSVSDLLVHKVIIGPGGHGYVELECKTCGKFQYGVVGEYIGLQEVPEGFVNIGGREGNA